MRFLSTPTRRIVAMNFFSMLAFQSTYFVGVIGCATYVLGLGALELAATRGLHLIDHAATRRRQPQRRPRRKRYSRPR